MNIEINIKKDDELRIEIISLLVGEKVNDLLTKWTLASLENYMNGSAQEENLHDALNVLFPTKIQTSESFQNERNSNTLPSGKTLNEDEWLNTDIKVSLMPLIKYIGTDPIHNLYRSGITTNKIFLETKITELKQIFPLSRKGWNKETIMHDIRQYLISSYEKEFGKGYRINGKLKIQNPYTYLQYIRETRTKLQNEDAPLPLYFPPIYVRGNTKYAQEFKNIKFKTPLDMIGGLNSDKIKLLESKGINSYYKLREATREFLMDIKGLSDGAIDSITVIKQIFFES